MENRLVMKIDCGENFAYVLEDSTLFLRTEYKILQREEGDCFLKCVELLYNGKEELYYQVGSCRPLSLMAEAEDAEGLAGILRNLLCNIKKVEGNGFLSPLKLQLSVDKIWVEPFTKVVRFVYLPLKEKVYDNMQELETELRKEIAGLLANRSDKEEKSLVAVSKLICRQGYLSDNIQGKMKSPESTPKKKAVSECRIISLTAGTGLRLFVDKDEFVIGKSVEQTDGTVSFSRLISRRHCKVIKKETEYVIVDLNSSNGTFLNGMKLVSGKEYVLHDRDILRMATSDFQIEIR